MSRDKSVRSLVALQTSASTSRVLNLAGIAKSHGDDDDYLKKPFFKSRALNSAVLLKHRLRPDEVQSLPNVPLNATKIILPFEKTDLRLGGQSIFIGQTGWREMLADVCDNTVDSDRDLAVMECLSRLPSLDPFLLREHLKRHGYEIGRCYFAISNSDVSQMTRFVSGDISKLIELAFSSSGGGSNYTSKLTEALLSTEIDDRLEPLRLTLRLEGDDYREGIFSWKGFLYYKWSLARLWPTLKEINTEIRSVKTTHRRDSELNTEVSIQKAKLIRNIEHEKRSVVATLKNYDEAFQDLTVNNKPLNFRSFLLRAPDMFLELGDKMGSISHISSFWRFRFPKGKPVIAAPEELVELLQEFSTSIAPPVSL